LPPSAAEPPPLRLLVPNDVAALEPARQAVLAHVAGQPLSPRARYRLELVLEETLMNRIRHAYPAGGQHAIALTLRVLDEAIELCVEDDGIAFDPVHEPPRQPATSLDDAEPGGLGLLLTRRAARDWAYERVDGRNHFTVWIAPD
jgi:anti-sigma regulatory factor (Ser/Thr protein kinase)